MAPSDVIRMVVDEFDVDWLRFDDLGAEQVAGDPPGVLRIRSTLSFGVGDWMGEYWFEGSLADQEASFREAVEGWKKEVRDG